MALAEVIVHWRSNVNLAQQYCVQADGTGRESLAVQYEYIRQPAVK
jgi:hypothetical protein